MQPARHLRVLKQASIQQIRSGQVTRHQGYLVACMAYYPRGLSKLLIDEYRAKLAPDKALFSEWKEAERQSGHDAAFVSARYEERFTLSAEGWESLRRLVDLSRSKDVYLACQCEIGERCHREMLLLTAREKLGAEIAPLFKEYNVYLQRIKERSGTISTVPAK